jgi:hypothetical protein
VGEAKFGDGDRVQLPSEHGGGIGVVVQPPLTLDGDWWYVVRVQPHPKPVYALFDEGELEQPD